MFFSAPSPAILYKPASGTRRAAAGTALSAAPLFAHGSVQRGAALSFPKAAQNTLALSMHQAMARLKRNSVAVSHLPNPYPGSYTVLVSSGSHKRPEEAAQNELSVCKSKAAMQKIAEFLCEILLQTKLPPSLFTESSTTNSGLRYSFNSCPVSRTSQASFAQQVRFFFVSKTLLNSILLSELTLC